MSVTLTAEQRELRTVVRDFFADRCPESEVRRLMVTPRGFDAAVWKQLGEQLGVLGLATPDEYGGAGFGYVEFGIVLEEAGRALFGGPLLSTALALEALLAAGDKDALGDLAPDLATGRRVGTVAFGERAGQWSTVNVDTRAEGSATQWRLTGEKRHVLDGLSSDILMVSARAGDGLGVFAVEADAPGLTVSPV